MAPAAGSGTLMPGSSLAGGWTKHKASGTAAGTVARPETWAPVAGQPAPGPTPARPEGSAAPGGRPAATAVGTGSPIVVGNVGSYSGPIGSSTAPAQAAIRVWAQWVNSRGGIAGHPVKLIVGDDAADQARAVSLHKQMVDGQGAIAFVGDMLPVTLDAVIPYLESKGIPLVGGDLAELAWEKSPMLFPQGPAGRPLYAAVAKAAAASGKRKFGLLYCSEAQVCANFNNVLFKDGAAKAAGLDPIYSAQMSIAQPDFTAECLSAQSRGVEVLALGMDNNSMGRVATSCARQGYRPSYVGGGMTATSELAKNAALDGFTIAVSTFPWTARGIPAIDDFHHAMEKLAPTAQLGASASGAWAAGQLLAKAGGRLSATPTSADFLDGLWALKSETLGGLAVPLTFHPRQPNPSSGCYFSLQARDGKFQPLNGGAYAC